MRRGGNWKNAVKYAAGILILAVSVSGALLFPQWHGKWQDQQTVGMVTLAARETIEFLDTDSLDIAGRMKLLSEAEDITWENYEGNPYPTKEETQEFTARCRTLVGQWCENGLLPEEWAERVQTNTGSIISSPYIYADQSVFQVITLCYFGEGEEMLTLVIDKEKDVIYYASVVSPEVQEQAAEIMGYDSYEEMMRALDLGDFPATDVIQEDYSAYDFAAVCGAESAQVNGTPGLVDLDIELQFEHFTAHAYRGLMYNQTGTGMAIMYGTERWKEVIMELSAYFGVFENPFDLGSATVSAADERVVEEYGGTEALADMDEADEMGSDPENMTIIY